MVVFQPIVCVIVTIVREIDTMPAVPFPQLPIRFLHEVLEVRGDNLCSCV